MLNTLRKEHPRLIVLNSDLPGIKKLININPDANSIYSKLKIEADQLMNEPPVEYKLVGPRLLGVSRRCVRRIYTLATMYRLEMDKKYLKRAIAELLSAAGFKDWHPEHFLDTAEMTHALAIGYDWLYDDLTDEERRVIREAIIQKGLMPAQEAYEEKQKWKWWVTCNHNWNQVCNGGIALGALAIADEEPDLCNYILDQAVKSIPLAMNEYTPDGGWSEGPGYWHYATRYNVYFLAGLKTALGTDFGLSDTEGFSEAGMFRIHFIGPTGMTFNFADAGSGSAGAAEMFWLARKFNKPAYAWHQRKYLKNAEALDLWWFDPRELGTEELPLDAIFHGVDVAFFRSSWDDPDAIFVGFKGGDNMANHSHLDLGTFVLDALGKRWALDLGGDDYNLDEYFGDKRWTYYRLKTEGQNTLVINDENQDYKAAAPITDYALNSEFSFAIADLSAAYANEVNKVQRGVAMVNRSRILMQDEIQGEKLFNIVWGFHTHAEMEIDGKKAILTQDNAHLAIHIIEPEDAEFKVASAQPPEPQNKNEGVSKLTIQLPKKVKSTRIAVEMVPYKDGETPSARDIRVIPLDKWTGC